ncbi:MAG: RNA 2',3'-cyclic phosphodiesterase [Dehalococcoidales bacterium]|nr:MAG: RNA 2',3'-cyclic phosphodiesterase [Dehalococcoidales bacterium]
MEQIRSFIAIELPTEVRLALERIIASLKSGHSSRVRWVEADSIHLTLKFLGNITADRIEPITGAIREGAQGMAPFRLEVKGLGAFPNLRRVQVAWAGVSGETGKLNQLQKRIDSNLAEIGFTPEKRPFSAHLTLGRVRDQASPDERQRLGDLLASTPFNGGTFTVNGINLMRSQLQRTGAVYSRVSTVNLTGA